MNIYIEKHNINQTGSEVYETNSVEVYRLENYWK